MPVLRTEPQPRLLVWRNTTAPASSAQSRGGVPRAVINDDDLVDNAGGTEDRTDVTDDIGNGTFLVIGGDDDAQAGRVDGRLPVGMFRCVRHRPHCWVHVFLMSQLLVHCTPRSPSDEFSIQGAV
jgi:hypothetical protein